MKVGFLQLCGFGSAGAEGEIYPAPSGGGGEACRSKK